MHFANGILKWKNAGTLLAASAAGICLALPKAFDLPDILLSVGYGSLPGGTWIDRLVAASWHASGWMGSGLLRLTLSFCPWFLGFLAFFLLARKSPSRWRGAAICLVWLCWGAAMVAGIWNGWSAWDHRITDLRLLAPTELVAKLKGSPRVFINPSAIPAVAALAPDLVDRSPTSPLLVQSPALWRAEDRKRPFSAVLLAGRVSEAKPLILHLRNSPDWHLAAVDNQGILFMRGEADVLPEAIIPTFETQKERAIYLAQYALCLEAVGLKILATQHMDEAMNLSENDSKILTRAASLAASRNRWAEARKLATKAQIKRPGSFEADYILACSLLETQASDKAYKLTSQLAARYPTDISCLLLHARACRAAKDFSAETATLEHLLRLVSREKKASSRIHIYLGQSWTQRGFPDQALKHYQLGLEGNPSPAEAEEIREAMRTIESNRLKSSGDIDPS